MLAVLPDTNTLFGILSEGSKDHHWQRLLGLSIAGEVDVVLPEVVQWELVNQLRERFNEDLAAHRKLGDKLRRAGLTPPAFGEGQSQAEEALTIAAERLRETVLSHRGRIAPVPAIPTPVLVRRSLQRHPPFNQQDRGMRDTILWLTALAVAAEGNTVVLVSNDQRAFGDGELHPALRAEVSAACDGDSSRVVIAATFSDALRIALERTSEARQAAEQALGDDDTAAEVMHAVANDASGQIADVTALSAQGWSRELLGARINEVEGFTSLAIEHVDEIAKDRLSVRLRVGVTAEVDIRHDREIEYNDWIDLAAGADIVEAGFGLVDPWTHLCLRRPLDLLAVVRLDVGDVPSFKVEFVTFELPRPRRGPGPYQLQLELR